MNLKLRDLVGPGDNEREIGTIEDFRDEMEQVCSSFRFKISREMLFIDIATLVFSSHLRNRTKPEISLSLCENGCIEICSSKR